MKKQLLYLGFIALSIVGCKNEDKKPIETDDNITRIGFASCIYQNAKPKNCLLRLANMKLDGMIFGGDNIYGDYLALSYGSDFHIQKQYSILSGDPDFKALMASTSNIYATWDDHDFGMNDGVSDNPAKVYARKNFCDFWKEPENSIRRTREDGIYQSYFLGEGDKKVQIICLDLRWNQSPHVGNPITGYPMQMDPSKTMLGDAQWAWLKEELKKPAAVRVMVSSVQFCSPYRGGEAWSIYPKEQQKMIDLIAETQANGIFFVSGDVHFAELTKIKPANTYNLYDLTSSGVTHVDEVPVNTENRIGEGFGQFNFAMINIDWNKSPVEISLEVRDQKAEIAIQKTITLDELKF